MTKKVVVICPTNVGIYSLLLMHYLMKNNIEIAGVVVRKTFQFSRFKNEFRRDGLRLLKKFYRKYILRNSGFKSSQQVETIKDEFIKEQVPYSKVSDLAKQHDIPLLSCSQLNSYEVIAFLKSRQPDCTVFTGGGLIRESLLQHSGKGVLNCHCGILPFYRGMDVVEWPMVFNDFDNIGLTVHYMDKGLDTGDIIQTDRLNVQGFWSINAIRNSLEKRMPSLMASVVMDVVNDQEKVRRQTLEEGRQFFIQHPKLKQQAKQSLQYYYDMTQMKTE